jgi:RNA polymerase sigma factor (TIGR02999 family)
MIPTGVYDELKRLAAATLRHERRDHTHQPTSLANEAFLRIGPGAQALEREALLHLAANAMREILVDHARRRLAQKRGGDVHRVALAPDTLIDRRSPEDLIAVDEAMRRLEALDPSLAQIVNLRYFGGLAESETAEQLGVSVRTVSRRWRIARMYLARDLGWVT